MHELWRTIATGAGVVLTEVQIEQFDSYIDRLIDINQSINLTRITDVADAGIKHVADALELLPLLISTLPGTVVSSDPVSSPVSLPATSLAPRKPLVPTRSRRDRSPFITLADVGTGGGIPGVILAIARPDIQVTLIDSTRKKLDAVKTICNAMNITNIRTLHTRMETVTEKFDIITARAVADLETLLGWCGAMMKPKSVLLAMKGPRAEEEIKALSPRTRKVWSVKRVESNIAELMGHATVVCRLKI
jgi:16S rRNA (guanine527-N7)-methyltransferase